MLADHGSATLRERERVLELPAHRESRPRAGMWQQGRVGSVASRAAQRYSTASRDARDGIIAADLDGSIVREKNVGDPT